MTQNYNEFHIDSFVYLQSYKSIVAKWDTEKQVLTLGHDWSYSMTTIIHIGIFMNHITNRKEHGRKEIQKAIDDGRITYDSNMK